MTDSAIIRHLPPPRHLRGHPRPLIGFDVFAVMGVRALCFMPASPAGMFCYLKYGISFILFFMGVQTIIGSHAPIAVSTVICVSLAAGVAASLLFARGAGAAGIEPTEEGGSL